MLKPAFGAISMLLALLIVAILAAVMIPMLKSTSGAGVGGSSLKQESVEVKADQMIKEIERQKEEAQKYYDNQ